jgi:Pyridoxamine 5'-phosphate oxidase
MSTLAELHAAAPSIAAFFEQRITATGLSLVATTRRDGWPRVSPMELSIHDGRLYVGSMPAAVKARDLQRDPRCCVITPLADKDDLAGEVKAFCRARELSDPVEWEQVRARWRDTLGFDIGDPGGSHVFELDIEAAAWQRVEGDDWRTTSWTQGHPVRERVRTGPLGESRDL